MDSFNLNIDELVKILKQTTEESFIKEIKSFEKDEDGQIIIPSLENTIEDIIVKYFEERYGTDVLEDAQKEYDEVYNILFKKISNLIDKQELLESTLPTPEDYYGLSEYQRNSGKY